MKAFLTSILICFSLFVSAQSTIRGKVIDSQTKEPLIGAQLYFTKSDVSLLTDVNGKFQTSKIQGRDSLIIIYVGYDETQVIVSSNSDSLLIIPLQKNALQIEQVVVSEKKEDDNIKKSQIGQVSLSKETLRSLPALMGEPDVIRALASSGGVTQIEGMQGIFVRGGSQDQNLILFDGATVYNPSHLLGFFSVFNSDIISSAELYKSGVQAKYGGRLSSVLEINSLPASSKSFESSISLGVLSSRIMTNIPITKKSALRLSFRKTYLNLFVMPIVEKNLETNSELSTSFTFYDGTARYDFFPNEKNRFSLSAYYGKDKFGLENKKTMLKNTVTWGNMAIVGQWKYISSNNWIHTTQITHSEYEFNFNALQNYYTLNIGTGVSNSGIHYVAKKLYKSQTFSYGINSELQNFNTGTIDYKLKDNDFQKIPSILSRSFETSIFAEHEREYSDKFSIQKAIRIVPYAQLGPATEYTYNEVGEITDTTIFKSNDIMYKNIGFEPRIQSKYILSSSASLKASISRTTQHVHMVSMLSAALPADIWIPASTITPKTTGWIYSIGYFKNFEDNMYESSFSVFYKTMNDILEFKDGFLTIYSTSFNQKLTRGKGFAFGTEFSLRKTKGKLQGNVSYNFSRTLRRFKELNNGYLYPASYDKPHDFTLQLQYELTPKLHVSALWVYGDGKVYSEPIYKFIINKNPLNEYGPLNNERMLDYHRLDISVEYSIKKTEKFEFISQLSVYNVYNRKNIYYVYYETIGDSNLSSIEFVKNYVGLFPILPSISIQILIL